MTWVVEFSLAHAWPQGAARCAVSCAHTLGLCKQRPCLSHGLSVYFSGVFEGCKFLPKTEQVFSRSSLFCGQCRATTT